jgi:hypothetical protein
MNDFAKMDIFFVVATVALVVLAALIGVAIYRVLRILRHVEHISELVDKEGELIRADIADMRHSVRLEGFSMQSIVRFFKNVTGRVRSKTKK